MSDLNHDSLPVFSARYWKAAAGEVKSLRSLTFAAMIIAVSLVTQNLFVPVGENLHISFVFLATALGAMIYGPLMGLLVGFCIDILGFCIAPASVFFPGYTLSGMLAAFTFAIFLYRSRVTVLRLCLAKGIVNYGINVGLGCLWSSMLYGKGYLYFFAKSIVKNTLMLPIEVVLLVVFLQLLLPVLTRAGVVPQQNGKRLSWI